jgi:hypothetical protein
MVRVMCLGFHDWRIEREVDVPDSNFDEGPMFFETGGVDYHCRCARCGKKKIESRRGVWLPLNYPRGENK